MRPFQIFVDLFGDQDVQANKLLDNIHDCFNDASLLTSTEHCELIHMHSQKNKPLSANGFFKACGERCVDAACEMSEIRFRFRRLNSPGNATGEEFA